MTFLNENFKEIILAIVGLIAAATITIKILRNNKSNNNINQNNNKVKNGDIVAGDKITSKNKYKR